MKSNFSPTICFLLCLVLGLFIHPVQAAYDIVKRARLIEDKYKTQGMMRPFGHDFIFEPVRGQLSIETLDLVDDVDKIGKLSSEGKTTQQQVDEADVLLTPYYDKENVLNYGLTLAMPIFSFTLFGVKWRPNLRIHADIMALITPSKEAVTLDTIIDNLDQIPQAVRDRLKACDLSSLSDGDDILAFMVTSGCATQVEIDLVKAKYSISKLPYLESIDNQSASLPVASIYAKGELKVGPYIDFRKGRHWFGNISTYALFRGR